MDNSSSYSCNCFSKVHPVCHNIANSSKPGNNSKKTDKHADCSKAVCWGGGGKVIYVKCINCSYNNMAKGIRLLDKKSIFCLCRKNFMQVRAFERYILLNSLSSFFPFQYQYQIGFIIAFIVLY